MPKKIRKFAGLIANKEIQGGEVLRQGGLTLATLSKIYEFQVRYKLAKHNSKKTTEEERLAKQQQRLLEKEAEALAKEIILNKFKYQYQLQPIVQEDITQTDSFYFGTDITSKPSA